MMTFPYLVDSWLILKDYGQEQHTIVNQINFLL